MQVPVLCNHRVGQAVCDRIEPRHKKILPDYVWGDGDPNGVNELATAEMLATVQAAQKLGVATISGFTGSPIWNGVLGDPPCYPDEVEAGLREFAERWRPILDACGDAGIRFALKFIRGKPRSICTVRR